MNLGSIEVRLGFTDYQYVTPAARVPWSVLCTSLLDASLTRCTPVHFWHSAAGSVGRSGARVCWGARGHRGCGGCGGSATR